jgi:V8-like Glu-specific endopeptidase
MESLENFQMDKTEKHAVLPAPLYPDELAAHLKPREPLKRAEEIPLEVSFTVAADAPPRASAAVAEIERRGEEGGSYEVRVSLRGATLGRHALRPPIETRRFAPEKDIRQRQKECPGGEGYLPDHLALRLIPERLPPALRVPRRIRSIALSDRQREAHQATTVFAPDYRYLFNDTAFPWCTAGRVDTPGGVASGVMVGPRHLLTCSHAIQWNADNTAGWVKFTPAYFDGSAPFGIAWGTVIYWEELKVTGPTIDRSEGQHDYVAVVLDRRIGDLTGWMGSRSWSDDWDSEPYWRHIGYPGDLAGCQRPSYQRDIALDGSFWDREVHTRIFHQGDVWPGQSGGPYFAWWEGESWPRVVAVQSGQDSDENSASGGAHMVDCISRARSDFP